MSIIRIPVFIDHKRILITADWEELQRKVQNQAEFPNDSAGYDFHGQNRSSTHEEIRSAISQMKQTIDSWKDDMDPLLECVQTQIRHKKDGWLAKGAVAYPVVYDELTVAWEDSYCDAAIAFKLKVIDSDEVELTLDYKKYTW